MMQDTLIQRRTRRFFDQPRDSFDQFGLLSDWSRACKSSRRNGLKQKRGAASRLRPANLSSEWFTPETFRYPIAAAQLASMNQ